MALRAIGILSPGDMGHAVGGVLVDHGMKVLTCLEGRSDRTRALAQQAGMMASPSYGQLVREIDMMLSILVPAEAVNAASKVAGALRETGKSIIYVDCNAVSPETKKKVGKIVTDAGGRFTDAGIIGGPPGGRAPTKFYVSGPSLEEVLSLADYGLDVRKVGAEIGQASGLKMTYAAMTKGLIAIAAVQLVAARKMGLYEALVAELKESQAERYTSTERGILTMVYRAKRWVGEMEEIALTFQELGLTPKLHQGAADVYRLVSRTPVADETAENYDRSRTLLQTIDIIAEGVEKG